MSCPHMDACPLYPLFKLQANLRLWQERYCTADYSTCARYKLSRECKSVPPNLLPNGTLLKVPEPSRTG